YANPRNQFWSFLAEVFGEPRGVEYTGHLSFLQQKALGLWDVLNTAERKGSSDSAIRNAVANDFAFIFKSYTNLNAIVFNGGKAQALFQRHIEKVQAIDACIPTMRVLMPSTSATPGCNVLSFKDKVTRWKTLLRL